MKENYVCKELENFEQKKSILMSKKTFQIYHPRERIDRLENLKGQCLIWHLATNLSLKSLLCFEFQV